MTQRVKDILNDALGLPAEERADVAAELLASLEPEPSENVEQVKAAWAAEIERRAQRVLGGGSAGESWDLVRERTARRLDEQ